MPQSKNISIVLGISLLVFTSLMIYGTKKHGKGALGSDLVVEEHEGTKQKHPSVKNASVKDHTVHKRNVGQPQLVETWSPQDGETAEEKDPVIKKRTVAEQKVLNSKAALRHPRDITKRSTGDSGKPSRARTERMSIDTDETGYKRFITAESAAEIPSKPRRSAETDFNKHLRRFIPRKRKHRSRKILEISETADNMDINDENPRDIEEQSLDQDPEQTRDMGSTRDDEGVNNKDLTEDIDNLRDLKDPHNHGVFRDIEDENPTLDFRAILENNQNIPSSGDMEDRRSNQNFQDTPKSQVVRDSSRDASGTSGMENSGGSGSARDMPAVQNHEGNLEGDDDIERHQTQEQMFEPDEDDSVSAKVPAHISADDEPEDSMLDPRSEDERDDKSEDDERIEDKVPSASHVVKVGRRLLALNKPSNTILINLDVKEVNKYYSDAYFDDTHSSFALQAVMEMNMKILTKCVFSVNEQDHATLIITIDAAKDEYSKVCKKGAKSTVKKINKQKDISIPTFFTTAKLLDEEPV